jgi:type 1 glutamine amidotransferase
MAGGGRSEDVHRARGALVVVAGEDTFHDLAAAGPMLQRLAIEAGFAACLGVGLQRFREPRPDASSVDVLVLYTYGAAFPTQEQEALTALVRAGMGLVAVHCANVLRGTPDALDPADRPMFELLGSRFLRHPPTASGRHRIEVDPDHPVTQGMAGFELQDEYYELELADGDLVLLARRERVEREQDPTATVPVAYARLVGRGRVVYLALGHDERAWYEPGFQALVRGAIRWAARSAGGSVDGAGGDVQGPTPGPGCP